MRNTDQVFRLGGLGGLTSVVVLNEYVARDTVVGINQRVQKGSKSALKTFKVCELISDRSTSQAVK